MNRVDRDVRCGSSEGSPVAIRARWRERVIRSRSAARVQSSCRGRGSEGPRRGSEGPRRGRSRDRSSRSSGSDADAHAGPRVQPRAAPILCLSPPVTSVTLRRDGSPTIRHGRAHNPIALRTGSTVRDSTTTPPQAPRLRPPSASARARLPPPAADLSPLAARRVLRLGESEKGTTHGGGWGG